MHEPEYERCMNCRYWNPDNYWKFKEDPQAGWHPGSCKRHSPIADRQWPSSPSYEWCGDFQIGCCGVEMTEVTIKDGFYGRRFQCMVCGAKRKYRVNSEEAKS